MITFLLLLLDGLALGAFLEGALPLKVLSITPSEPTNVGSTDRKAVALQGTDPITVVFTRPVIALGSDFQSLNTSVQGGLATTNDKLPFKLMANGHELNVKGKLRWPTTYIARFDPDQTWPTDLEFQVQLNTGLTTYDGVHLSDTNAPVAFQTPFLSGSITKIDSKTANNATGGQWAPSVGSQTIPEAPPDAQIRYEFNNNVTINLLKQNFILTAVGNNIGQATVDYELCPPLPRSVITWRGMSDFMPSAPAKPANLKTCVLIKPHNLQADTTYNLAMAAGSKYDDNAGVLHETLQITFRGLSPFTFLPLVGTGQARYRRYDLYLRHGLQKPDQALNAFKALLTIRDQRGATLPFDVSLADPVTLRVSANFNPTQRYIFTFMGSPDVKDGFGQPFVGVTLTVDTTSLNRIWEDPVSDSPVFTTQNAPTVWKLLAKGGAPNSYPSSQTLMLTAITPTNVAKAIAYTGWGGHYSRFPGYTSTSMRETNDLVVQSLALPSGFFLRQTETIGSVGQQPSYSADFCSITDLGVTAIYQASSGSLTVWVTSLTSAQNVAGANVYMYENEQSWNRATSEQPRNVAAQGVTGADGVAVLKVGSANGNQVIYVTHQNGNKLDQTLLTVSAYGSVTEDGTRGEMVTDRGVYKPGDTVNLKVFVTRKTNTSAPKQMPWGGTAEMTITWENGKAPDWQPVTEKWPAQFDPTYGTWSTSIDVPENATFGSKSVDIRNAIGQNWIASTTILVSDPRRPTASMEFKADQIWVLSEAFKISTTVLTGTDQPIAGAKVDVKWTSTRPSSMGQDSPQMPSGTFTLTTDENGKAVKDLNFPFIQAGDSFNWEATYLGPTGELIKQSAYTYVQTSKWSLSLSPSSGFDQVPGFTFGWLATVSNADGEAVDRDVSISLYAENATTSSFDCKFLAKAHGSDAQCTGFKLDTIGKFTAVGTAQDDKGHPITTNVSLGQDNSTWKQSPLSSYHLTTMTFRLDKSTYAVGDQATVKFESIFAGRLLLSGQGLQQQSDVTVGTNALSFTVPQRCYGGCNLALSVIVPPPPASFSAKVKRSGVPVSRQLDLNAPRKLSGTISLTVPDTQRSINVDIKAPKKSAPGQTVSFNVKLSDPKTQAELPGEVAVFVVDKAFLQVVPHPMTQLNDSFKISNWGDWASTWDSREKLVSPSAVDSAIDRYLSLYAKDPWVSYDDSNLSEESLLKQWTTRITQWGGYASGFDRFMPRVMSITRGGIEVQVPVPVPVAVRVPAAYAASAAPMAMAMAPMMDRAEKVASPPAGGGGGGGDSTGLPVRTKFETAPLFVGRIQVSGNKDFSLPLPDNIGSFSIRAYAVDAKSRFGQAEAEVVSTKPITIQPMFPRFARPGDVFDSGVTVAGDAAKYNGQVTISATALNSTVSLTGIKSKAVTVSGTTPVKVKFPMAADKMGEMYFRFSARDNGTGADAFEDKFSVLATQDPVLVATSMAIQATPEGKMWDEGIQFPPMIAGSGTLNVSAALGRLPAIETLASVVFSDKREIRDDENAHTWVARAMFKNIFDRYPGANGPVETGVKRAWPHTLDALKKLTDDQVGMVWSTRWGVAGGQQPDLDLNLFALYMAFRANLDQNPAAVNAPPFSGMTAIGTQSSASGAWTQPPVGTQFSASGAWTPPPMGTQSSASDVSFPSPSMVWAQPPMGAQSSAGVSFSSGPMVWTQPPMIVPAIPMGRGLLQNDKVPSIVPPDLVQKWASAVARAMVIEYYDAVRYEANFSNWDMLAQVLTVLGLDWQGQKLPYNPTYGPPVPQGANPASVLNLASLQSHAGQLSYGGEITLALAYILRQRPNKAYVDKVVSSTISRTLTQGRTAYVKAGPGSNLAAPFEIQAMALELLVSAQSTDPRVEKLANYLAQGNAGNAGSLFSFSDRGNAMAGLAFAVYDKAKDNLKADVDFTATSGSQVVLQANFKGAKPQPLNKGLSADSLPQSNKDGNAVVPEGLHFVAKGTGEVSVAALINFVPASISPDPIYRGIYVERMIQRVTGGEGSGPNLQVVQAGDFVMVTIQITTPDDLSAVLIQDLLPAGLEAVDDKLSGTSAPPVIQPWGDFPTFSRSIFPPWRDPFDTPTVYPDRVTWQANFIRSGTYSVNYVAVAVTTGTFLHPPTKVVSVPQPEVMGLSGGGFLVVTEETVPQAQISDFLKSRGVPRIEPVKPIECDAPCAATESCNLRTGKCEDMVNVRMLRAVPSAPQTKAPVGVPDLKVGKITSSSAQLTWTSTPGSQYIVAFRKVGDVKWTTASRVSQSPYVFNNLASNTDYQFRVQVSGGGKTTRKAHTA